MSPLKLVFYCLFLFLTAVGVYSQSIDDEYVVEYVHFEDGPENLFLNVFQDSYGFIWFGSQANLLRYNGYNSKRYHTILYDPNSFGVTGIKEIIEDHDGNVWIGGTGDGLNRYDRKMEIFNSFQFPASDSGYIKDAQIEAMLVCSSGSIWIGTEGNGLFELLPQNHPDSVKIYNHSGIFPYLIQVPDLYISSLVEGPKNMLWIGTNAGLFLVKMDDSQNPEFIGQFIHNPYDPGSISDNQVSCLEIENDSILWIGTGNGLNKLLLVDIIQSGDLLEGSKKRVLKRYFVQTKNRSEGSNSIAAFCQARNRIIWIGTGNAKLYHFNPVEEKFSEYNIEKNTSLLSNLDELLSSGITVRVTDIEEDKNGNIWISTFTPKLIKISPSKKFISYSNNPLIKNSLSGSSACGFFEDHEGILWVRNSDGLNKIGRNKNVISVFKPTDCDCKPKPSTNDCSGSLIEDPRDQNVLWMSSADGLLIKFDKKNESFTHFAIDPDNPANLINANCLFITSYEGPILWVGTLGGGLKKFNTELETWKTYRHNKDDSTSLSSNNIMHTFFDSYGEMWVATFKGLNRRMKDSDSLKFIRYYHDPNDTASISDDWVMCFMEDNSRNLWIGTIQGGLNKYDRENDLFQHITEIPDNVVNFLVEDRQGYFWVGTSNGLLKWQPGTGEYRRFDRNDGLVNIDFGPNTFQSPSGEIVFGGVYGMDSFFPEQIKINDFIPPIVITEFILFNEPCEIGNDSPLKQSLDLISRIDLSYEENFISFEYAALNFINPQKNQYRYMMEGLDEEWVDAGTRRFVNYSDMNPGEYTFRVVGSNNDGIWNEEGRSIDIIIHPPWYRTGLAYGSYGLLFFVALFGFIRWRTWSLEKDKRILEGQVRERTTEIEKQKEELESTLENLKHTQSQLIQSEKLASLGGLVAGVAHEINTPVGIGVTAVSSLMEDTQRMAELYKKEEISRKDFKEFLQTTNNSARLIQKNLERTAQLVQSFKQVSTDQATEEQREFVFKTYLEDVIRSLYPKFKNRNIEIKIDCDETMKIDSFPGIFAQIFTNLVLNSINHGFREDREGAIDITVVKEKGNLNIEFKDNGVGITEEILPKIFDPFFTTDQSKGTGLGLNIVFNLVTQKLGGTIECESREGEGVEFLLQIPIKDE